MGRAFERPAPFASGEVGPELPQQHSPRAKPLVFVVDDDPSIASVIADGLEYMGFETEVAWNGARALERLAHAIPAVIVLDLMMPVVSGWSFLEEYQAVTGGLVIPIVVLSAAGTVPDSSSAHGVRSFIPKPFDLTQLVSAVQEAVAESRKRIPPVPPGLERYGRTPQPPTTPQP